MPSRVVRLTLTAVLLVSVLPGVASATNWAGASGNTGCSSTLNKADNRTHYVWYNSGLRSDGAQATNQARNDNLNPTAVNTVDDSSSNADTDAVVYSQYYTTFCGIDWSSSAGFTMCVSTNPANECERHEIRYNEAALDQLSDSNDKSLACHELGHSVGLKHRQVDGEVGNGCMDNNHWYGGYTGHDEDHLSAHY